ncbi:MAG: FtsB family cell division protein [bacterium]
MKRRHLLKNQIENERKKRRLVVSTALFLILLYLGMGFFLDDMGFLKYLHLKKVERKLVKDIALLEQENTALEGEINNLRTNPYYLEKHARENLNLSRPDEYIFLYDP